MSYADMLDRLNQAFEANVQKVKSKALTGVLNEPLSMCALSGPSGIGKTACVEDFARQRGFSLVKLDCSYEPADNFVAHVHNAINAAKSDKPKGTVLLIDNIDQADEDYLGLLSQLRSNSFRAALRVAQVPTEPETAAPLAYRTVQITHDAIPPEVFIVGEMRPD
jgi:hypothetical protein